MDFANTAPWLRVSLRIAGQVRQLCRHPAAKHIAETSGPSLTDPVTFHAEDGRIVIERPRRRLSLGDILEAWPKEEMHKELDRGPGRGTEV